MDVQMHELATGLRALHKALLEVGRVYYERDHGPIQGPTHLLHLLVHDAAFAWLRSLSELMADLDEMLDAVEPTTDEERGAVRGEIEHLFSPSAPDAFWARFSTFLQEASVAIAYAQVRQVLLRLPRPKTIDPAVQLHESHRWAEARKHRR